MVAAFEQSLSSMTTRLQQLSSTSELKDCELERLRKTIDVLKKQGGSLVGHAKSATIMNPLGINGNDGYNTMIQILSKNKKKNSHAVNGDGVDEVDDDDDDDLSNDPMNDSGDLITVANHDHQNNQAQSNQHYHHHGHRSSKNAKNLLIRRHTFNNSLANNIISTTNADCSSFSFSLKTSSLQRNPKDLNPSLSISPSPIRNNDTNHNLTNDTTILATGHIIDGITFCSLIFFSSCFF